MRLWLVGFLAACGSTYSEGDSCPANLTSGDACSFSGRCWLANDFSSCRSEWCTCSAGRVACEAFTPRDGDACEEPITQCSYEGNPGCETLPTAEWCSCDERGTWRCRCSCYGGQTTCSADPCSRSPQQLSGALCADHDVVCSYPDNTSCRCERAPDGLWVFACS